MNKDYDFVASQIPVLERLISSTPKHNVLGRKSLEARLNSVRLELETTSNTLSRKARLTFKGKPVDRSHGITTDFGTKATAAFSDAYTAVAAALADNLNYMGQIPDRSKNQLLITGIARGSFGFEFELPSQQPEIFTGSTVATQAMETVESLLRLAATGNDEEVTEIVDSVHPRAARKVHEFLSLLEQNEAWCGLEFSEKTFKFKDLGQLNFASDRLKKDNIKEDDVEFIGQFHGLLPAARSFEFVNSADTRIIHGKIDINFGDPNIIFTKWLRKLVSVKLHTVQVGQARPRYTLMSLNDIKKATG